jgi:hypothetical protein
MLPNGSDKERIKILSETLPNRCCTCHKNDQYDAVNNICFRCRGIENNFFSKEKETANVRPMLDKIGSYSMKSTVKSKPVILTILSMIVGLVIGFFFPAIYYVSKYGFDTNNYYAHQLELSLTNPESNPPIILSINNVTTLEFDEKIIQVVKGNDDFVEVSKSTSPNKIYLIGKKLEPFQQRASNSGNLIIETENSSFNLYFSVVEGSYPGAFNVLVTVKKDKTN